MRSTLEITTKIGCINNCVYCAQKILVNQYDGNLIMSKEQFIKILSNTPKDIQIDFTGFCEPFLSPHASWMIKYAAERYDVVLATTLTGFNNKDAEILRGTHIKQLMIHDYEGYGELNQDKVIMLIDSITFDKIDQFKLGSEFRFSRAGNVWGRKEVFGRLECGWDNTFSRNVVLPNGDVYLCCMDYGLKHKLGNLSEDHYNDLNRKKIIDLCQKEDSNLLCRKCEIAKIN